ncbi:MAG: transporter [Planctomycetota bacterium]|nr:transporter [Planctomycetota bacterium]
MVHSVIAFAFADESILSRLVETPAAMEEDSTANGETGSSSDSQADRLPGWGFLGDPTAKPVFGPKLNDAGEPVAEWPNISEPGPDMGDYPNSAFTLPKGRSYLEFSPFSYAAADSQNPSGYATPILLRYGLTDDVEIRLFGNGLTAVGGPSASTGFSPLVIDTKIHLWNDRREWLIPAVSLEAYVQTDWGSSQFDGGIQPSVNLNFDLPITKKTNLEWSMGFTGSQQAININTKSVFIPRYNYLVPGIHRQIDLAFEEFGLQWAIEHQVTERFQVFLHGFHNRAAFPGQGQGEMVGTGLFWRISPRLMGFGSVNTGLTDNVPPLSTQIGFAMAL